MTKKLSFFSKLLKLVRQLDFFQTFKDASIYFSATFLVNVLGLISLPIYTWYLSPADFGIVEIFNNTVKVLAILLPLNIYQSVQRYYFEEKEDWNAFLGTTLIASAICFSLLTLFFIVLKKELIYYFNIPEDLFFWLLPATLSLIILSIFNQLFVARKNSKLVSLAQLFLSYSRFLGAFLFILLYTSTYYGKILGDVIVLSIIAVFLFYKISPFIKWTFKKEHLKYILSYSVPLIPFSISGFILHFFDLYMINHIDNNDAGVYAVAYKIGFLFMGLDQALLNAGKPDFFKWMNNCNYAAILTQIRSILKLEMLGAAFIILYAFELGELLIRNPEFHASLTLIPIIVLGYFLYGTYGLFARLFIYKKNTFLISFFIILTGIINVLLNSYYIPIYGYHAAAYTTLASYSLLLAMASVTTFWFLNLPMPPIFESLKKFSILILLTILTLYFEQELSFWIRMLIKSFCFVLLAIILFWSKIIAFINQK